MPKYTWSKKRNPKTGKWVKFEVLKSGRYKIVGQFKTKN